MKGFNLRSDSAEDNFSPCSKLLVPRTVGGTRAICFHIYRNVQPHFSIYFSCFSELYLAVDCFNKNCLSDIFLSVRMILLTGLIFF